MSASPQPPSPPPGPDETFDPAAPEPRRHRRWLPIVGIAALLLLITIGLWPRPIPVEIATAAIGPLRVTIDEEGVTQVRHRYIVSSPVAGHLRRITLRPGAIVVAGETVLAELEPGGADLLDVRSQAQAEARVRAAESARARAETQVQRAVAALELAQAEAGRAGTLAQRNLIPPQQLEIALTNAQTAEQDARGAEFALQVAGHELEQARTWLDRTQPGATNAAETLAITSPINGRVLRVLQESARIVPGGLPLLEVGDPADLEVRIEVLSRDGVALQPGARVWLDQWGGEAPLEARVRLVEPAAFTKVSALGVEEQRVNVLADLVAAPSDRVTLGDGYRVDARIERWFFDNVLQVPAGALFQQAGEWRTFVLTNGRAELRTVEPGPSNGLATQIRRGLDKGDTVIVYPGDRIQAGGRVTPLQVSR